MLYIISYYVTQKYIKSENQFTEFIKRSIRLKMLQKNIMSVFCNAVFITLYIINVFYIFFAQLSDDKSK